MKLTKRIGMTLAAVLVLSLATPVSLPMAPTAVVSATTKKAPKISVSKKTLNVGKSFTLKVTNAKKVTWKSNKTTVATVNKNGKVSAIKSGTATITATADKKKLTCKVTVKNPAVTKAGFSAKEYVYKSINMVIPKGWETNSNSNAPIDSTVIFGSESMIIANDTTTGSAAMKFADFKDYLMLNSTPESIAQNISLFFGLTDTKVTDLVFKNHKSTLGTAVAITYMIEGTDAEGTAVKIYANGYFLSIKNHLLQVETFSDSIEKDYQQVLDMGTYLFDSMTIVK